MLEELTISNFAIIERLAVRFDPGFNVLTGETGAGKSIIIDAVGAVLGGRVSGDMVRSGAPLARVEGVFTLDEEEGPLGELLRENELLDDDDEGVVILRREINAGGRSTARVNGHAVPIALLGRIGELLIDIHGQSEHLSLFRVDEHLELLDRYAGNGPQRARLAALVQDLRRVRRERDELHAAQADAARRLDLLRYQLEEITSAALRPDEEEELAAEKRVLANAERLAQLGGAAGELLSGGGTLAVGDEARGALDLLNQASAALDELVQLDESQREALDALNGALYTLEEVSRTLHSYSSSIEADPAHLAEIEERLDLLHKLKRKYGPEIADVIAFGERAAREQHQLVNSEERLEELDEEIELLKGRIGEFAAELSGRRREAAERLAAGVERELDDLNMARARFVVNIEQRADADGVPVPTVVAAASPQVSPKRAASQRAGQSVAATPRAGSRLDGSPGAGSPTDSAARPGDDNGGEMRQAGADDTGEMRLAYDERGVDRVEFLISPNPGEELKPLARIASGGEASRLMLALKTMLSSVDRTPTLIFDEVDTGVGGRGGQVVGEKLRGLGETHQVLCITHLPQVAALGAEHLRVLKRIEGDRTHTEVESLHGAERIAELAAMLGGTPPPPSAFKAAEELLARAG